MHDRWRKTGTLLALSLALCAIPAIASAHNPRFVREAKVIEIKNPDISQAFYGWLDGQPALYRIKTDVPQKLYMQILVPDVPQVKTDLEAGITYKTAEGYGHAELNGTSFAWKKWYEEYGGEWYLQGPDTHIDAAAGTNIIMLSNADNYGPYVFVVGDKESFPFDEMVKTVVLLLQLHQEFFLKPWYSTYFNKVGLYLSIPLLFLIVLITSLVTLYHFGKHLMRRAILILFGLMLAALDAVAIWDFIRGNLHLLALDYATLFASLAGYVGIVWTWKRDKSGVRHVMVTPNANAQNQDIQKRPGD